MSIASLAICSSYQGISLDPKGLKDLYFQIMKEQRAASCERHPEFDAIGIFREIITLHATDFTRSLPTQKLEQLPRLLAEAYRAASRFRLQPYPGVQRTPSGICTRNIILPLISDGRPPTQSQN